MLPELSDPKFKPIDITGKLKQRGARTPDFPQLRFYTDGIPLFVYDGLMRGCKNHGLLEGAKYCGKAFTTTDHYRMYLYKGKSPILLESSFQENTRFKVKGELYLVLPEHITLIDAIYSHGSVCVRKKLHISMQDQKLEGNKSFNFFRGLPQTQAFMYIGKASYWENMHMTNFWTKEVRYGILYRHKDQMYIYDEEEVNELWDHEKMEDEFRWRNVY